MLADLADQRGQQFDDSSHLSKSHVGKEELHDHTLRSFVDEDLNNELDDACKNIDSLPTIATFQATQQREVDKDEIQQNDNNPGKIFRCLRNDKRATKATIGECASQGTNYKEVNITHSFSALFWKIFAQEVSLPKRSRMKRCRISKPIEWSS